MDPRLLLVAAQLAPEIIDWLRTAFHQQHADATDPTDADIIAALNLAIVSSLAKDEQWLLTHPPEQG